MGMIVPKKDKKDDYYDRFQRSTYVPYSQYKGISYWLWRASFIEQR